MAKQYTLTADDRQAVFDAANTLGVDAGDLMTAIRYETAGSFNPGIVGGDNNHFQGLIQFGPAERKMYGVTPGMTFAEQMRGPVVSYLKDRGLQPGMNLDQIYTAINYGNIRNGKVPYGFKDGSGRTLGQNIKNAKAGRDQALAALYGTGAYAEGDRTLHKGMEGMDVAALQMRLQNAGLYSGPIDGKFGKGTAEAVRATERAANLRIDKGVAGPQVQRVLANSLPQFPAAPNGAPLIGDMSTEAMGFGNRLPPAALFPTGGPVPPMPIPMPYAGNGPGRSPTGPIPFGVPSSPHPVSSPYVSDAGGQRAPVGDVQTSSLAPLTPRLPGGAASTLAPNTAFNPFSNPQPWGAVGDQSPATLAQRLTAPSLPSSPPFGFAQAGGAGSVMGGADATGGRNVALSGRAPVNFANANDATELTPGQLRDQKSAQDFGNFASGVGQMFSPFFGGAQPVQAAPQLKTGVSAAYAPRPAMAPINLPTPTTITPQQFQQRFSPMGAVSIPPSGIQLASASNDVRQFVPRTSPLASAGGAMSSYSYNPLSSAYVAKPAPAPVAGVTFAAPAPSPATVPSSKLAPSQFASPAALSLAGGAAGAMAPGGLGGSLAQAGAFGVGVPTQTAAPKPTPMVRVAKAAVPIAASMALGPIGGLLARGVMNLATGGPLAQRVGQAIAYANAAPRSNPYSASPFTPAGFTTPNYSPVSGGSIYAYRSTSPGVGSYINSAGRTINYNVNADQAVYGPSSGLGGFTP